MLHNSCLTKPLRASWHTKGGLCWQLGACRLESHYSENNRPRMLSVCCEASLYDRCIRNRQGRNSHTGMHVLHEGVGAGTSRPGRLSVGVAMAAAVWSGPEASIDEEQSWWAASPLSWRTADEREQWRAEQQLFKQQQTQQVCKTQSSAPGAVPPSSVDQEAVDTEQQWLQPYVLVEPPQ